MIPHGRTETGKLVISRSEISDGMRRINASQDRMLNRRLESIERQERTAQANHQKTVKRAVGDLSPKSLLQQTRGGGATVDLTRRESDAAARLLLSQRGGGASLDLAQYDAIKSRRQSQRLQGQNSSQDGEEKGGDQPSLRGHRWSGLVTSMKAEGLESGGVKTLNSTAAALDTGGWNGRPEVSHSPPQTQRSLVANGHVAASSSHSPSRPH